jgi:hypothetical protein
LYKKQIATKKRAAREIAKKEREKVVAEKQANMAAARAAKQAARYRARAQNEPVCGSSHPTMIVM